ncbi:hypothetical protein [Deinococcus arenicola]|uniref:Transposase n=1 Tax=Deinococcus arenicola TaxID=2994950 RepID=A0ABU4DTT3_9DEIO|nr:hypothetical protein [Deinococcus sp. ZS9-10]MDV6375841.1 hypothetical protein [Deinococcus sp. ZS9-10]
MSIELFLTLLVVFWLVLLLVSRGRVGRVSGPSARPRSASDEDLWLQKLLTLTLNNRGAIERGVTAKRRNFPSASRAELLERVHTDYMRDRR